LPFIKQPVDETGQTGIIELIDEHDQQLTKADSDGYYGW
jgi:hypothetical protein